MALTKKTLQQVEITETDHVQVRTRTVVEEDGVEIATTNHRHVLSPVDDYSGEEWKVRSVCDTVFIPVVKDKYVAENEYRIAEDNLKSDQSQEAINREKQAKTAMQLARKAYDDFVKSKG